MEREGCRPRRPNEATQFRLLCLLSSLQVGRWMLNVECSVFEGAARYPRLSFSIYRSAFFFLTPPPWACL